MSDSIRKVSNNDLESIAGGRNLSSGDNDNKKVCKDLPWDENTCVVCGKKFKYQRNCVTVTSLSYYGEQDWYTHFCHDCAVKHPCSGFMGMSLYATKDGNKRLEIIKSAVEHDGKIPRNGSLVNDDELGRYVRWAD